MKSKTPLEMAEAIAKKFLEALQPDCDRIVIAGSIRRRKSEVGDIELLYISKFGIRLATGDMLYNQNVILADLSIERWLLEGIIRKRPSVTGVFTWGPKNKLAQHCATGIGIDLFATTEENWWNSLVIRTGGKDMNLKLTTGAQRMGRKLNAYGCGVTESNGNVIPATSEEHVFELCGVPYLKPEDRP